MSSVQARTPVVTSCHQVFPISPERSPANPSLQHSRRKWHSQSTSSMRIRLLKVYFAEIQPRRRDCCTLHTSVLTKSTTTHTARTDSRALHVAHGCNVAVQIHALLSALRRTTPPHILPTRFRPLALVLRIYASSRLLTTTNASRQPASSKIAPLP